MGASGVERIVQSSERKLAHRIFIFNSCSDSRFVDLFSSIRLCWWPCGVPQQFLQNCDSLHV